MGFRGLAARRRADIGTFTNLVVQMTSLTTTTDELVVPPAQTLELCDVTLVCSVALRSAAADVSVVRAVVGVQSAPSGDVIGSWDALVIGADGSTDSYQQVVIVAQNDGLLLPLGENLRLSCTLDLRAGVAPQVIHGHFIAQLRRRLI